jgi:hypothetical protein
MAGAFVLLLAITIGYQALYCYGSLGGDWTGLFYSGDLMARPPELASGFEFHGSRGYDGQQYRVLAHDPLNRKGYWTYLDDARFRSRRILIPAAAAMLGAGSRRAVDLWFVAIVDVSLALGGLCFVLLTDEVCPRLATIAIYSAIPAVVASTDRMVLDGPLLAAFLAAWLFLRQTRPGALWVVLACAPLVRESGILLNVGVALVFLRRRDVRGALTAGATAVPSLAWWWWGALHTAASGVGAALSIPLVPQIMRAFRLEQRPVAAWQNVVFQATDLAASLCLLIAFGLVAAKLWRGLRRNAMDDDVLLVLPSAVLAAFAGGVEIVAEPYSFARVDSVLLAWAGLTLLAEGRRLVAYTYLPACGSGLLLFRVLPLWQFLRMVGQAGRN